MSRLEPLAPVLVVSTHLDDAVLSCGHFLYANPSTTVVTVLAGAPHVNHEGYNSETTGQPYAPDAIAVRRGEDRLAMEYLGATPVWLDLFDADYKSYRPPIDYVDVIREEVSRVLDELHPKSVLVPLGLMHADHLAVADACLELALDGPFSWYLYMDLPYGFVSRRALSRRIRSVGNRVSLVELDAYVGDPAVKQRTTGLYASQYDATRVSFAKGFDDAMRGSERYWRVEPVPAT
ncbi:MAG: PIG-L family deacetylase [Acidimicrobiales bacterium]|jgi:LmbE family N-acetylglucosaminyl deacetylase